MNTTTTASPPAVAANYASFGARLVALILDYIIIGVLQSFVIVPILGLLGLSFIPEIQSGGEFDEAQAAGMVAGIMAAVGSIWILTTCITFFYFTILESSKSQGSIGKIALGIKVTDMNGDRITFGKAALRTLGRYISAMIMFIGYLLAAFTEKKQTLHDMIASTLVVKK
jgi:uncharacterized RDD family membrane protein YckC